ncbi:6935_t:CDS:10 [Paraglomus occultum]|uniref:Cholesterol oxidase n=1 Tax=Paraglomus occultum TaxID=144539 RepID=A0A9N9BJJ9_9GLOM|nr:6935_t:CDS:10 [Paraglomus occultum]
MYKHISKPVSHMQEHYDVVVIGSGYGGAIAASRMARANKRVALLEKGKERWPGEYPETLAECLKDVQIHSKIGHTGKKTGMYQFYLGEDQKACVACGLGGTSLINANVALEADELTWRQKNVWPAEIYKDYDNGKIKEAYNRAGQMLEPNVYPSHWPELPKLKVFEEQARLMGSEFTKNFHRAPITVHFENRINNAGVRQQQSTLSGNDATGINDGSKNSTLMNYIPDAWNHGAEIFCEVQVKKIKKNEKTGLWVVYYEWLGDERPHFGDKNSQSLMFVTAEIVFVAAGTFGTNEIMLRSKTHGLSISNELGKGFSGNGDILGFAYDCDRFVNGNLLFPACGIGTSSHGGKTAPVGPCITGIIDMRKKDDNAFDGYVIEEGSCPRALAQIFSGHLKIACKTIGDSTNLSILQKFRHSLRDFIPGYHYRALSRTQSFLVMSHDDQQGKLELQDDRLNIAFPDVGKTVQVERLNKILSDASHTIGGTYVPSPVWTGLFRRSLVTVHPIGGCVMADNSTEGVVNYKGQVFKGDAEFGTEVHDGLYVCDASVIPSSLGVNPFYTIAAFSELICERAAEDRGWRINYELPKQPIDFDNPLVMNPCNKTIKKSTVNADGGLRFTEVMQGYFSTEIVDPDAFITAEDQARSSESRMQFLLTIIAYDYNTLHNIDNEAADIVGTISCRALSPDPLMVTSGKFRIHVDDNNYVDSARMMYSMDLVDTDGKRYKFEGFKFVKNSNICNAWKQTSTLYVTVKTFKEPRKIVGLGVLRIGVCNFLDQLTTLKATGETNSSKLVTYFTFVKYFLTHFLDHYIPAFLPLEYPGDRIPVYNTVKPYSLQDRIEESYTFTAKDGVVGKLRRYRLHGRNWKAPVLLVHGAAMTHEMWTTDLQKSNLCDYLLENDYDVWLIDYRLSPTIGASQEQHTLDDLALDIAAGVNKVREVCKVDNIGVISHCLGSMATFMGLLTGEIEGVGTFIASQVGMHPIPSLFNRIKNATGLLSVFRGLLGQKFFDVRTSRDTNILNRFLDFVFRFLPFGRGQYCRSALCHRATFCYGPLYRHENLNEHIHDDQHVFFGTVNITTMAHASLVLKKEKLVKANGEDIYVTEKNIKDKLNFPIAFIYGEKNAVFDTESTKRSYDLLIHVNGIDLYDRKEVKGHGHLDVWWSNKSKDAFEWVKNRLEDTAAHFYYPSQQVPKVPKTRANGSLRSRRIN